MKIAVKWQAAVERYNIRMRRFTYCIRCTKKFYPFSLDGVIYKSAVLMVLKCLYYNYKVASINRSVGNEPTLKRRLNTIENHMGATEAAP